MASVSLSVAKVAEWILDRLSLSLLGNTKEMGNEGVEVKRTLECTTAFAAGWIGFWDWCWCWCGF